MYNKEHVLTSLNLFKITVPDIVFPNFLFPPGSGEMSESDEMLYPPSPSYADVVSRGSTDKVKSATWLRSFQREDEQEAFERAVKESIRVIILKQWNIATVEMFVPIISKFSF